MEKERYALLLLDGEEPSKEFITSFLKNASCIIATDGAAGYAVVHNIHLNVIIGDMDSISDEPKKYYESKGTRIIEEPDQHTNDFEKALRYILSESLSKRVVVLGIHGKRTDHLLTNFSVMLRYTDRFESIVAYDATHEHHFLTTNNNHFDLHLPKETRISLTPLPEAAGVTTAGLFYPIVKEHMTFGKREGLSNIMSNEHASVEIADGALLISIPFNVG